jgi:uncharacterized protein YceK
MMIYNQIKCFLLVTAIPVLVCAMSGCATVRKPGNASDTRIYMNEANNSDTNNDYREIHKKLRPLERPQVKYAIESALVEGDSCWVLLRITVPDKSMMKHERYNARIELSTEYGVLDFPELSFDNDSGLPDSGNGGESDEESIEKSIEIDTRKGKPSYAYLGFRFCYHSSMKGNGTLISISPSLETKRYFFLYLPIELPVRWSVNSTIWKRVQKLPQFILLDKNPDTSMEGEEGTL